MTRPRRVTLWSWLALIALPIACQWPDLSGWLSSDPSAVLAGLSPHGWTGDPWLLGRPWADDAVGTILQPLGGLAARQWLSGEVPWWNHFSGVGMPLAGEMQPAAFLLPFDLLLLLPHGTVLLKIAMQIVAGLGMRMLLRGLGAGRLAALVGAVLFETNGTFALFGDAPMLPIAFLPWLLLGIERARATPGGVRRGWALIAVAIAGSLVAGFPETAYFDGLLAVAWAGTRLIQDRARLRLAARAALGVLVGVALAAPVLLAFAEFLEVGFVAEHLSAGPSVRSDDFATLLLPYFSGPPYADIMRGQLDRYHWAFIGGYVSPALALTATAALLRRPDALRWTLFGWVVLVSAAAGLPFARALFDLVPAVRYANLGRYATASCECAVCVLAALAIDDVTLRSRRTGFVPLLGALWLAAGFAAAVALRAEFAWLRARPELIVFPIVTTGWAVVAVAGATVALVRHTPSSARALGLLLSADAVLLFVVPTFCGLPDAGTRTGVVRFVREHIGLGRVFTFGPIAPNTGARFGIATLDHTYLPVPSLWADYIQRRLDRGASKILFNGVSDAPVGRTESHAAALARRLDAYEAAGVSLILADATVDIFGSSPVGAPRVYDDGLAAAYALPDPAPYFDTAGVCTAAPRDWRAVRLTCPAPATLIRRELSFPGWHATVNGCATPVGTAAEIFESVAVPAGISDVRFRYAPPHVGWTWGAMALGVAALGGSVVTRRARDA